MLVCIHILTQHQRIIRQVGYITSDVNKHKKLKRYAPLMQREREREVSMHPDIKGFLQHHRQVSGHATTCIGLSGITIPTYIHVVGLSNISVTSTIWEFCKR